MIIVNNNDFDLNNMTLPFGLNYDNNSLSGQSNNQCNMVALTAVLI